MYSSDDPLVSVIVPTYKRHDYLVLTLKSILAQSYTNLEVLVVSDGDDKDTRDVVSSVGDSRARYLHVEHVGYPSVPRNVGLKKAQGELLAFCDDDDVWYAGKLALQVPVLVNGQYGMCTCDYDFINPAGKKIPDLQTNYSRYHGEIDWRLFFHSMGFICNAAGILTRAVYENVGGLDQCPELKAHEDFEYWMRILKNYSGYFMNEKLVGYRVHPGSIQKAGAGEVLQRRLTLHKILKRKLDIPRLDYGRKLCKLWAHYAIDRFRATNSRNE